MRNTHVMTVKDFDGIKASLIFFHWYKNRMLKKLRLSGMRQVNVFYALLTVAMNDGCFRNDLIVM